MARTATRTANIYTRVDPETNEQAEAILNQPGIPMSNAIRMFLKQIVMHRGIPFDMTVPTSVPVSIGNLTIEQFDIEAGYSRFIAAHNYMIFYIINTKTGTVSISRIMYGRFKHNRLISLKNKRPLRCFTSKRSFHSQNLNAFSSYCLNAQYSSHKEGLREPAH